MGDSMNEIQDERYYVANEAILDAFLLVLKEKDMDKITVSDIIKKAGIVRSTYYNHFENIP
ncbi:MAG: TetR/AcrR family transcriptional regulator, partial [Eubacterium sp.]|nr:TetR/AcrR family transcriptional regulator [Eubacterium sp.]